MPPGCCMLSMYTFAMPAALGSLHCEAAYAQHAAIKSHKCDGTPQSIRGLPITPHGIVFFLFFSFSFHTSPCTCIAKLHMLDANRHCREQCHRQSLRHQPQHAANLGHRIVGKCVDKGDLQGQRGVAVIIVPGGNAVTYMPSLLVTPLPPCTTAHSQHHYTW